MLIDHIPDCARRLRCFGIEKVLEQAAGYDPYSQNT